MVRTALALSLVIGGAIVACSDFGSSPSSDPPDGGVESGSTTETGTPPAAPSPDAGPEASTGWIPCAQRAPNNAAHFCDDFDFQSQDIKARWTGCLAENGSCGQTPNALSPTKAFQAHTDKAPPLGSRAQLYKDKDGTLDIATKTSIVLSFWMRVEGNPFAKGTDTSRYAHVAVIELDDATCITSGAGKGRSVELSFTASANVPPFRMATKGFRELCVDGGGPTDMVPENLLLDLDYFKGAYHHVTIDMKRGVPCTGGSGGSVKVRVDENPPKCLSMVDGFKHAKKLKTLLGQYVGANNVDATAEPFDVFYDNVTLDID